MTETQDLGFVCEHETDCSDCVYAGCNAQHFLCDDAGFAQKLKKSIVIVDLLIISSKSKVTPLSYAAAPEFSEPCGDE